MVKTSMSSNDCCESTYSFCFFFGPGLPRGFAPAAPSGVRAAALRLVPVFGPPIDFRLPAAPAAGGASKLDGVLVPLTEAAGTAESEGLADGVDSTTGAAGVPGDEAGFAGDAAVGRATCGNLTRWSGDSLSTTVFDLADLGVDILEFGSRRRWVMESRCRWWVMARRCKLSWCGGGR
jgi:hypothetical protein